MKRRIALCATVMVAMLAAACDSDPAALDPAPASVQIVNVTDSLLFGTSVNAAAEVRNADNIRLTGQTLSWTSSEPEVLSVNASGAITAHRPGSAYIRAQAGAVRDSVRIRVSTVNCSLLGVFNEVGSNFRWAYVWPGSIQNAEGTPVQYMETNGLYESGLVVGTHPDTTLGAFYPFNGRSDFAGRVCVADDGAASHMIADLKPNVGEPAIPDLRIVQDFYAFDTEQQDDFILLSFTFTNDGSAPITDIAAGYVTDFDLYNATNVASFDPATGVADVVAVDSAANSIIAGFLAIDEPVTSYRAYLRAGSVQETRQTLHAYVTGGLFGPDRTAAGDVRQIMGVAPFDLQPGEKHVVWFAIVGGENRTAFDLHVDQARAMARSLD